MSNVWCVRAGVGTYTKHFVEGGYVGIGYDSLRGSEIAAVKPGAERSDPNYRAVVPKTLIPDQLRVKDMKRQMEAAAA